MPRYKLIYFDYQGHAEPIRLALTHAGVPFEDVRHTYDDEWQQNVKTPYGVLPILEIDGNKVLPESMTIMRYIGAQHGLQASDPFDRALGDALATTWMDTHPLYSACDWDTMEWNLAKVDMFVEYTVIPRLKHIDEHLSKSKSGYLTGDKVTWADFYVYTQTMVMKRIFRISMEKYPHVAQFQKKMDELPAVKSWHQTHPNDTWGGGLAGPYGDTK